jgi:membrane protein YdbS with pleckstrin-like domain
MQGEIRPLTSVLLSTRRAAEDAARAGHCRILTRMAYPRNLIQDGETVALDLRPHWWYFSRNILTGIPLAIILILVFANVDSDSTLGKGAYWIVALVFLAWAAWLVLKYFQWVMTYFVVTSRRVIYRTGVLSKKGVEIPLERINNINFHQRLIDRIIGAGDLDIESAGKDGQSHFDFVRHPDGVQHEIYRQMETRNMPQGFAAAAPAVAPAVAPVAPAPASVPEQIEQLARLRDQGHITEAEYEQKKSELLGRM